MSITDTLIRANENPIAAPWTAIEGVVSLFGNEVYGVTGGGTRNAVRYSGAGLGNDQEAELLMTETPTSGNYLGPCVRCASGAVSYYAFVSNGTNTKLIKVVTGTPTDIATGGDPGVNTDNLRISVIGTTIKGYVNDVEKLSTTDSALASGDPGFMVFENGGNNPLGGPFVAADVGAPSASDDILIRAGAITSLIAGSMLVTAAFGTVGGVVVGGGGYFLRRRKHEYANAMDEV